MIIKFWFIENGKTCSVCWSGSAESEEKAIEHAKEFFGFEKDNLKITKIEVIK